MKELKQLIESLKERVAVSEKFENESVAEKRYALALEYKIRREQLVFIISEAELLLKTDTGASTR